MLYILTEITSSDMTDILWPYMLLFFFWGYDCFLLRTGTFYGPLRLNSSFLRESLFESVFGAIALWGFVFFEFCKALEEGGPNYSSLSALIVGLVPVTFLDREWGTWLCSSGALKMGFPMSLSRIWSWNKSINYCSKFPNFIQGLREETEYFFMDCNQHFQ